MSMSEQVIKNGNVMERSRTRTIAQVAMLGAVAGVLMNFEVPLPFLAPSFYQLDFSHPDFTVGFGISPNQPPKRVADYTAGREFRFPRISITLPRRNFLFMVDYTIEIR